MHHTKRKLRLFSTIIGLGISLLAFTPLAQAEFEFGGGGGSGRPEGAVSCFDYYTFGSVQVDASPVASPVAAGSTVTFKGTIKNANPYPIVDGQVWVKIFKTDGPSDAQVRLNGYPTIDFVLAKDNVSIAGKAAQEITFDWHAPSSAGGEYQAVFFFTSAHRYNLLGLSFTDDVVGNKANFSITRSATDAPVSFDKNALFLNKTAFHPVTFLQHFTKDEVVTLSATLVNTSSIEKTISVTWITSKWDGILASNEAKRETVSVTLKPRETKKITYTPPTLQSSVTFVQAIAEDADAKSVVQYRFVRDGYEEVRTNFPGIMSYPLVKGTDQTLFSCVHSTNSPLVDGGLLTLTLKDASDKILHTYTYTGGITGAMMGVKDTFTPIEDLADFSLTAKLEHAGSVVEEVTLKYDCNAIDAGLCPANPAGGLSSIVAQIGGAPIVGGGIVALLLALGGGYWIYRKKRVLSADIPTQSPQ